jgi:hypothetical protein
MSTHTAISNIFSKYLNKDKESYKITCVLSNRFAGHGGSGYRKRITKPLDRLLQAFFLQATPLPVLFEGHII